MISVIIPVYNRAWSIHRAIDSVLSQTLNDFEIITVDDGSTDETGNILKQYNKSVKIITQENLGVSAARNAGIRASIGDFIALLDSDDEWLPTKLQAQMDFFKNFPEHKICQTTETWIRHGKFVNIPNRHKKIGGNIYEQSLKQCMITSSSVMMRRELLNETGLFNETLPACEDYDLWLRIVYKYPAGLIEKEHLIRYGGHEDQLSAKYFGNDRYRIRAILNLLQNVQITDPQRILAIEELRFKCKVYAQGCVKRGKDEEAKRFLKIAEI